MPRRGPVTCATLDIGVLSAKGKPRLLVKLPFFVRSLYASPSLGGVTALTALAKTIFVDIAMTCGACVVRHWRIFQIRVRDRLEHTACRRSSIGCFGMTLRTCDSFVFAGQRIVRVIMFETGSGLPTGLLMTALAIG